MRIRVRSSFFSPPPSPPSAGSRVRPASRRAAGALGLAVALAFASVTPVRGADLAGEIRKLADVALLPRLLPAGTVASQVSSAEPGEGNDDGFSGAHSFLRKEAEDRLVIAELEGPGVVDRIWTPTPTRVPLEFFFDGEAEPRLVIPFEDLFSGDFRPFVPPLVGREIGGCYCYFPIPFSKSLKIVYAGSRIQFHQIAWRKLAPGETIESFPAGGRLPSDAEAVLGLVAGRWADARAGLVAAAPDGVRRDTRDDAVELAHGERFTSLFTTGGRLLELRLRPASAFAGPARDAILRISWDDETTPSVEVPVQDFFGFAFGRPSMRSLLLGVEPETDTAYCTIPMPWDKGARLEIERMAPPGEEPVGALPLKFDLRTVSIKAPRHPEEGWFRAVRRRAEPPAGEPWRIVEAKGRGRYLGTIHLAQGLQEGMTLFFEGDDRWTIDGETRIRGTGSEDFYNGGWYALPDRWDEARSLPLHGSLAYSIPLARTGGYRLHVGDAVPFEKSLELTIEHGGEGNAVPVDYATVALLYSDTPPVASPVTPESLPNPSPGTLEYWPQLLPIRAVSAGSSVKHGEFRDEATGRSHDVLALTPGPDGKGFFKVELEIERAGLYEVLLSYARGPGQGRFSVRRRQVPVTDPVAGSIDAFAETPSMAIREKIGEAFLRPDRDSLTFEIDGRNDGATGGDFSLHRILLRRID